MNSQRKIIEYTFDIFRLGREFEQSVRQDDLEHREELRKTVTYYQKLIKHECKKLSREL